MEAASQESSVRKACSDALSHGSLEIRHDEFRLEFRKNFPNFGEQLLVHRELSGGHDDREDADRTSVVVGDDVENLTKE